jgi:putative zinc finger protein
VERAPLRPVPSRPPGPVDADEAVAHVAATLPALDDPAVGALGLVALAGRSRDQAAAAAGLEAVAIGDALARARKALRRSMFPLPGSGWCERAERLVSDRLDGALEPPGPARLDAHLRNCPRCVEHERRLVQATDALVSSFGAPRAEPAGQAEPAKSEAAAAPLSVVRRGAAAGPAVLPFGAPVKPAAPRPPRPRAEPAPPAPQPPVMEPVPPPEPQPPAAGPGPAPAPAVAAPQRRADSRSDSAVAWGILVALAVLLAVATIAIAVAGVLGASL